MAFEQPFSEPEGDGRVGGLRIEASELKKLSDRRAILEEEVKTLQDNSLGRRTVEDSDRIERLQEIIRGIDDQIMGFPAKQDK